jgi:hypothetical protein
MASIPAVACGAHLADESIPQRDRGHPIGAMSSVIQSSARRIVDRGSILVFGPEEPIEILPGVLRVAFLGDGNRTQHGFQRFEIKSKRGATVNDWLVLSESPYANGWFTQAQFKRGSQRSAEERMQLHSLTPEEAQEEIVAKKTDPWETSSSVLTAAPRPMQPVGLYDHPHRAQNDPVWVFGMCEDPDAIAQHLSASEAAAALVRTVERGGVRLGPAQKRLHRRTIEEANALMFLAIRQALAGPAEVSSLIDQPVMSLVRYIFEDHLYNHTRRCDREDGKLLPPLPAC